MDARHHRQSPHVFELAVRALTEIAPCATAGCENTATHNHRHCRQCYNEWKSGRADVDVVAAPTGACASPGCENSTIMHHKYCSNCYKSWRMTRGQCKWRHADGSLCQAPVAGGNPFCQPCYEQRYLPCIAEGTNKSENVPPHGACADSHDSNGCHPTPDVCAPLPTVERASLKPHALRLGMYVSDVAKSMMHGGAAAYGGRSMDATALDASTRAVSPSSRLRASAPTFTPSGLGCVGDNGVLPAAATEEESPWVPRARPHPLAVRPIFAVDGGTEAGADEASAALEQLLLSPGAKAERIVAHTWTRVNAQAASAAAAMRSTTPAAAKSVPPAARDSTPPAEAERTWTFSVFPGGLTAGGGGGDAADGGDTVPDPFAEKMRRLLCRGRDEWGAPPAAAPLVRQFA